MKNPLHYQLSEYDCGPTSMLNAMSFLFSREEIPPEIVRNIMLYCLDCFGADGTSGKSGTSRMAMMFLSNWLDGFGRAGHLPVRSRYLSGRAVNLRQNGALTDALRRGGAAVVRLYLDEPHYVLMTGLSGDRVELKYILRLHADGVRKGEAALIADAAAVTAPEIGKGIVLYYLQPGETVWDLAKRYRVPLEDITRLNPNLSDHPAAGTPVIAYKRS